MSDKIKVSIIHTGSVIVDRTTIFEPERKPWFPKLATVGIGRTARDKVETPVAAYLIEHPLGRVLVDTGFHKNVQKHPIRELSYLHYRINKPVQRPGEAVDERLAAMGLRPADLDYVVLTHLHTDHAGGVKLVADARNKLVSKTELDYAATKWIEYVPRMWEGVDLKTFQYSSSDFGPQKRAFDLFGDGTLLFVNIPGHTPGLSATLIRNNGKFLLLTSDCAYSRTSWEQMILPGIVSDREASIRSLEWVREMSRREDCIDCLANHETELKNMIYEF